MRKILRERRWQNVGLAFGIVLGLIALVFAFWHVAPFGDHSLLMSDMGTQYIPLLTALQHALRYHVFHLYTFSQSIGGGVVPTLAYYLMSPFNLIVLLFNAANVPVAASVIIMVKIATIAATMTWFLQVHFKTGRRMSLVFGLTFAFCGFVAVNFFDLMWLDALIVLPLVAHGIDRIVTAHRPAAFFWWLWVSIMVNYYLGYMTCLFSVCYVIYGLAERSIAIKDWWRPVTRFVVTAALSGASAALLLVPTGIGMLQTAKGTAKALNFRVVPEFGPEFFTQFGLGATNDTQRLMHAPTVFVSSAVALLVLVYFVHPKFSRRQKLSALGLLGALFIGMWLRMLNTAWHLMQAPAGFPFRNVFFFSFVMVMLAFAAWQAEPGKIALKWQRGLPFVQAILAVGGAMAIPVMLRLVSGRSPKLTSYYGLIQRVHWGSLGLATVYVFVTALVIFGTRRRLRQALVGAVVISEVGGNFILAMSTSKFGSQSAYASAYQVENQQMSQINDPDGQLYRVQNENTLINQAYQSAYKNYNDSLLFNFHGVSGYNSALNERTRQTLQRLGLFSDNVRRISSVGLTPVTNMLFGVKQTGQLTTTGNTVHPAPGFVGMGFATSSALTTVQLSADALVNQEAVLQAIRPSATPYWALATQQKDHMKIVHTVKGVPTKYIYHHVLSLTAKANGPMYFWAQNGKTKYSTMRVNGKFVTPETNANGESALIKLGTFKTGDTVKVQFGARYPITMYGARVMSLRQTKFDQAVTSVKRQTLAIHTVASHFQTQLSGQVQGTAQKNWLYLSLANDSGWQAWVNGKQVATKRVLYGLTAIPITVGNNRIKLVYHVSGGRLGRLLSLAGFVGFAVVAEFWRHKDGHQSRENKGSN